MSAAVLMPGSNLVDVAASYVGGQERLDELLAFGGTLPPEVRSRLNTSLQGVDSYASALDELQSHQRNYRSSLIAERGGFRDRAELLAFQSEARGRGLNPNDDPEYLRRLDATPTDIVRGF